MDGGTLVMKAFAGGAHSDLMSAINKDFDNVRTVKPDASRPKSGPHRRHRIQGMEETLKLAFYRFVCRRRPFRLGFDGPVCIFRCHLSKRWWHGNPRRADFRRHTSGTRGIRRHPLRSRNTHTTDALDRPWYPADLGGDGHGRIEVAMRWRRLVASACFTELDTAEQADEVRAVKKFESGMVVAQSRSRQKTHSPTLRLMEYQRFRAFRW